MLRYIVRRVAALIPMLILLSIALFIGMELVPLDPLNYLIDPETAFISNVSTERLRESLGLNDPLPIRYVNWLGRTLRGEWGFSLISGAEITTMVRNRLPATMQLSFAALLLSTIWGIAAGFISAIKQNTAVDYVNSVSGLVVISIPNFFLGMAFIFLFALNLRWFPVGGRFAYGADSFFDRLRHMVMPTVVLAATHAATLARITRVSMLEMLNSDFIKTARSKGLSKTKVYIKHALRNAMIPVMLTLVFRLPMLIGGSVAIENLFAWLGMGSMMTQAVNNMDYPVVMATVLSTSIVLLIASMLADILTAALDPRVRIGK